MEAGSAFCFDMDIKSLRVMGSLGSSGRPTMWIVRGTAALDLLRVSVSLTAIFLLVREVGICLVE